jgi:hypothetical protein
VGTLVSAQYPIVLPTRQVFYVLVGSLTRQMKASSKNDSIRQVWGPGRHFNAGRKHFGVRKLASAVSKNASGAKTLISEPMNSDTINLFGWTFNHYPINEGLSTAPGTPRG